MWTARRIVGNREGGGPRTCRCRLEDYTNGAAITCRQRCPQLLDWLKSELLTPKIVMLPIANDAPPVFVKVKLVAALAVPVA